MIQSHYSPECLPNLTPLDIDTETVNREVIAGVKELAVEDVAARQLIPINKEDGTMAMTTPE